jgi:flagellar biosynthesis/type III secretory pathway protein FliH
MNSERIREIQLRTAFPDSRSVMSALLQVWNECGQESAAEISALRERAETAERERDSALAAGREQGHREGMEEMRERAALLAVSASRAAESIGQMEERDTASRDRMFARSREGLTIADAIRALPVK